MICHSAHMAQTFKVLTEPGLAPVYRLNHMSPAKSTNFHHSKMHIWGNTALLKHILQLLRELQTNIMPLSNH